MKQQDVTWSGGKRRSLSNKPKVRGSVVVMNVTRLKYHAVSTTEGHFFGWGLPTLVSPELLRRYAVLYPTLCRPPSRSALRGTAYSGISSYSHIKICNILGNHWPTLVPTTAFMSARGRTLGIYVTTYLKVKRTNHDTYRVRHELTFIFVVFVVHVLVGFRSNQCAHNPARHLVLERYLQAVCRHV